jgi:hypothetical protein
VTLASRAFCLRLGEGTSKGRGDINKIGVWGGSISILWYNGEIRFISWHRASSDARFWYVAPPKAKIGRCSCTGKFCPPVTASPDSLHENKLILVLCTIRRRSGKGSRESMAWFLFLGFVFGSAGKPLKKKGDGKTTNRVVVKN